MLILLTTPLAYATMLDDSYHFADYQDVPNVEDYGEWWYFNLVQDDLQAVIQYSLWDPLNKTGDPMTSLGLMYVGVFRGGEKLSFYFPVPWSQIVTSNVDANLVMGPNRITVLDENNYLLEGLVADEQGNVVTWSLQYTKTSESINGLRDHKLCPLFPNDKMSWYTHMPSAAVSGVLVVNGEVLTVDAMGYHDHNWGAWKLYLGFWNWFQTTDGDLTIVGYDFRTSLTGDITVDLNGERTTFKKGQYLILNYGWRFNLEALTFYPTKTKILAYNGEHSLQLTIKTQQTDLIGRLYDMIGWVVFESTATFKGSFDGHPINSVGYKEYTTDVIVPSL